MSNEREEPVSAITVLGGVGTGKSSLLNAITREYIFETGQGFNATTKSVEGITKEWKGLYSEYYHFIDTPGLIDSDPMDRQAIQEMVRYFRSIENGVSAFLLVFSIEDIRLDAYTQNILTLFHQLLGSDFWKYVILVFTHVDEGINDDLVDTIEAVQDQHDGFVAEIQRIYKPPRGFQPSVIFTSTLNARSNKHTQNRIDRLHDAVFKCKTRNKGNKFTCTWLREVLAKTQEEEKTTFIKSSIAKALASVCPVQ